MGKEAATGAYSRQKLEKKCFLYSRKNIFKKTCVTPKGLETKINVFCLVKKKVLKNGYFCLWGKQKIISISWNFYLCIQFSKIHYLIHITIAWNFLIYVSKNFVKFPRWFSLHYFPLFCPLWNSTLPSYSRLSKTHKLTQKSSLIIFCFHLKVRVFDDGDTSMY